MLKKVTPTEAVTFIGLIASVGSIGWWLIEGKGSTGLSDYFKIISFTVFLIGIVMTLREISAKLETLKEKTSYTATAIQVLETADAARRDSEGLHVIVTSDIITDTVRKYAQTLSSNLAAFPEQKKMRLDDYWPIHTYLYSLADSLPHGSCWFGITLLAKREAWNNPPDEQFDNFAKKIRGRAKDGDLHVFRIYYFDDRNQYENMVKAIKNEVEYGINIKILIGSERKRIGQESISPPDDISLVWVPHHGQHHNNQTPSNIKMVKDQNRFKALCAIKFGVKHGYILTNLELFSSTSSEFTKQVNKYLDFWNNEAKEFME